MNRRGDAHRRVGVITSDDLEMPMNLCLQILNATDALKKFHELKKIII